MRGWPHGAPPPFLPALIECSREEARHGCWVGLRHPERRFQSSRYHRFFKASSSQNLQSSLSLGLLLARWAEDPLCCRHEKSKVTQLRRPTSTPVSAPWHPWSFPRICFSSSARLRKQDWATCQHAGQQGRPDPAIINVSESGRHRSPLFRKCGKQHHWWWDISVEMSIFGGSFKAELLLLH